MRRLPYSALLTSSPPSQHMRGCAGSASHRVRGSAPTQELREVFDVGVHGLRVALLTEVSKTTRVAGGHWRSLVVLLGG